MVNIVVSKNKLDFQNYRYFKTLKDVVSSTNNIDVLVLFYTAEDERDILSHLSSIRDNVNKVVYICNKDLSSYIVRVMVNGMGGVYCEDDDIYSNSEDDLNSLVEDCKNSTMLVSTNPKGSDLITGFVDSCINDLHSGVPTFYTKKYLEVVKSACDFLITEYKSKDIENTNLSRAAYSVLSWAYDVMGEMEQELGVAKESFNKIQESLEVRQQSVNNSGLPVFMYPQFIYRGYSKVLRIKELGSVNYLTSFILGFRSYLINVIHLRPKLIFIYPVGIIQKDLYNYSWVSTEDSINKGIGDSIIFTNTPTSELITNLLNDSYFDTFIVVDRTTMAHNHIVKKGIDKTIYAVSGETPVNVYKLNKSDCILSNKEVSEYLCGITRIEDYPKEENRRVGLYTKKFDSQYKRLANRLEGLS
jgi:hypothetical protein